MEGWREGLYATSTKQLFSAPYSLFHLYPWSKKNFFGIPRRQGFSKRLANKLWSMGIRVPIKETAIAVAAVERKTKPNMGEAVWVQLDEREEPPVPLNRAMGGFY